jgi:hypothetical protein
MKKPVAGSQKAVTSDLKPATINIGMILFLYNQGLGSGSKSQGDHWL